MERVLVTGGAGFIGSHIVDLLLEEGYEVRVLDSLESQVHSDTDKPPEYLNPAVEFIKGNVLDREVLAKSLQGVSAVIHEAAAVGVGQSMYQIYHYVLQNDGGTAALLDAVVERRDTIKKVIVASSMSAYGEGKYMCDKCGPISPSTRSVEQMQHGDWELKCSCGQTVKPIPTDEEKPLRCESVYAISKKVTEEYALVVGNAYDIPTVALRYFNVYGPRQALSNPYTGLLAIVASRVLNKQPPIIFEDGGQIRDFINVRDVARANLAALRWQGKGTVAVNVGTGKTRNVIQVASTVRDGLGQSMDLEVTGQFRAGDIRHCYSDPSMAKEILGFEAEIPFEQGIVPFLDWASEEEGVLDLAGQCLGELKSKGLVK